MNPHGYSPQACNHEGHIHPHSDIDECASNLHDCQQICINTVGGYNCSCQDGYLLQEGGLKCAGNSSSTAVLLKSISLCPPETSVCTDCLGDSLTVIVALAVGLPLLVVVIALVTGLVICYCMYRRKKQQQQSRAVETSANHELELVLITPPSILPFYPFKYLLFLLFPCTPVSSPLWPAPLQHSIL